MPAHLDLSNNVTRIGYSIHFWNFSFKALLKWAEKVVREDKTILHLVSPKFERAYC